MKKVEFLTIYPTFEQLEVVRQTLPSIIDETRRNDAALIVHDSSVNGRQEKWEYLRSLNKENDFFLILSDNLPMAQARNMCLFVGQEMFCPDYICMVEDDLGFRAGLIEALVKAMDTYYGVPSANGLRYGLFTGCGEHHAKQILLDDGNACPHPDSVQGNLGGANSCFRCAPASHWQNILKGYDTDEYLISTFQTKHLNYRNYHKGFTTMLVDNGKKAFHVSCVGRGVSSQTALKLWDEEYTASDKRSRYRGKDAGEAKGREKPLVSSERESQLPKKGWLSKLASFAPTLPGSNPLSEDNK